MNVAKVSANGQITMPVEIRRALRLNVGDKVLFFRKDNGEIVIRNTANINMQENENKASILYTALERLNIAMEGEWEKAGIYSEDDLLSFVKEARREYNKSKKDV